ncbi:helix-hairpin-helix domain-containing protein [bacterium]|nr:helix-hairpin-helix domain-containing protein [bacterium]
MKQFISMMMLVVTLFAAGASFAASQKNYSGVINVNTATAQELMILPGIGEAKAKVIIEARTAKPFSKNEDLLNVKGIGEKTLAAWQPYIVFEGQTTLKEVAANDNTQAAVKKQ